MKKSVSVATFICLACLIGCQNQDAANLDENESAAITAVELKDQVVEASCGECQFGLDGDGCNLAIRVDGNILLVDGSSIDDHGDAHGDDGMCNCIRHAKVTGEIRAGRFIPTSFNVLPNDETKKQ